MRSFIFWSHLVVGLVAAPIILIMSFTGVLLTYELQIVDWVERQYRVSDSGSETELPIDQLIAQVENWHPEEQHYWVRVVSEEGSAVNIWAGPNSYLLDPYTGEMLREGEGATADFFHFITDLHRWLAVEGEGFALAQAATAYSNLLFLFLIISGIYLWLPKIWRWQVVKLKILFLPKASSAKVRDYNWHHVFSFWALVPLLVIVLTATIFYFDWANRAIYGAFGEEPWVAEEHEDLNFTPQEGELSYQSLLELGLVHAAQNDAADWYSIWIEIGEVPQEVRLYIDRSIGRNPEQAYSLHLNTLDGSVTEVERYQDWTPGGRAWTVARYLHTGEHFGLIGQTLAGLASLAACFLVYTGVALAYRRLVVPRLERKRAAAEHS